MKRIVLVAVFAVLLAPSVRAADRFEPGLWRSSSLVGGRQTEAKGPRCITAREGLSMNGAADAIRSALESDPAWQGCRIGGVRAEGMQVDFTATCAGEVVTTSRTTYAGSSYEGTIAVTVAGAPMLAMTIRGERIGPCP